VLVEQKCGDCRSYASASFVEGAGVIFLDNGFGVRRRGSWKRERGRWGMSNLSRLNRRLFLGFEIETVFVVAFLFVVFWNIVLFCCLGFFLSNFEY
jgi:hypothetical protein